MLDAGVELLKEFQRRSGARGRFIVLYLGLRRMGPGLAALGSAEATASGEIEEYMDRLLTKRHRQEPLVVLTAPFGTTAAKGPYSARTGGIAPGNKYPTNIWRSHLGIQKGVGCPADPTVIADLLRQPARRLACPHLASDPDGQHLCSLAGTSYRGEEHSIWLRKTADGWQSVDLDQPAVYDDYLKPGGERIPIFPLIGVLYCGATDALPQRQAVGIPEFCADFRFGIEQVADLFDCDPVSPLNASILRLAGEGVVVGRPSSATIAQPPAESPGAFPGVPQPQPLPELSEPILLNSGVGAELAVAEDLARNGWEVSYRGSQSGMGYDLETAQDAERLYVEVKSSVGFTSPELTESEWRVAQEHGERFVLAIVDFYGSPQQALWYIRDPATNVTPGERPATIYRLPRAAIEPLSTDAEFL
ncbi:MAG: DUF3883 domain-containing protein [Actinobacteria bacterium]|nr:DUF3883 domain-containing protein [Actinomycetota bacterium]